MSYSTITILEKDYLLNPFNNNNEYNPISIAMDSTHFIVWDIHHNSSVTHVHSVVLNSDNTASIQQTTTFAIGAAQSGTNLCKIDNTHFATTYFDNDDSSVTKVYVIVYEYNSSTGSISEKSYYSTSFSHLTFSSKIGITAIDSTHIVVSTAEIGGTDYCWMLVFQFVNSTLSLLHNYTWDSLYISYGFYSSISMIDSTHAVVVYQYDLGVNSHVEKIRVIEFDSSYALTVKSTISSTNWRTHVDTCSVANDRVLYFYNDNNNGAGRLCLYSYNSSTFSLTLEDTEIVSNSNTTVVVGSVDKFGDSNNHVIIVTTKENDLELKIFGTNNNSLVNTVTYILVKEQSLANLQFPYVLIRSNTGFELFYSGHTSANDYYLRYATGIAGTPTQLGNLKINIGGVWKDIPTNGIYISIGGVWKSVDDIKLATGGEFKDTTAGGTTDTTPPSDVSNLRTTIVDIDEIDLAWDEATDNVGVDKYEIWQKASGGNYTTNPTYIVDASQTDYAVMGLQSNTTYYFKMKAKDAVGNESVNFSNEVSATTSQ